jgi:acyl transferase domain-containing protein
MSSSDLVETTTGLELAIVGMAGRFPGAADIDAFWRNIRDGVESVLSFSDEALRARGVPEAAWSDPAYVKAGVELDDMDQFDAGFFGFSPRDAEQLDPQQRLFLESAWQALEHAGYAGVARPPVVGIYAGSGANLYLLRHLLPAADLSAASDISALLGLMNGNENDSLTSRVAYKLNLRGPAVSVQTACSTSLVAVHLACRSLLNHETDLALAGGVWLNLLQGGGYRHQAGSILSPDGHCRAFDARAAGTIIGSGVAVVALRRLCDALAEGDTIHAVIKGSAVNNDGAAKVGYTAPSVEAQAEVIRAAQAIAEVPADSIGYVEAHGTGTALGDPIEVAALTQAFRASTQRRGFCAIGSVKTNVGHLDAAAGVTGLIKAVLALKHKILPPSLNFERPNPQIDLDASPFYVNTKAKSWPSAATPRRAGVSSFGMGGTNVHLILEEAPPSGVAQASSASPPDTQLLMLSARSLAALDVASQQLAVHMAQHPEQGLADVAHTLRVGRARFEHRAVAVCRDPGEAVRCLSGRAARQFFCGRVLSDNPSVAFLFPGQGAQHVGMGRGLYETEPVFRGVVDRCCEQLAPGLATDLRELVFLGEPAASEAASRLARTAITQPALFVFEYALAQLWMSWGLQPDAMLGHSVGEYVAGCLAGVFTLGDALALVSARGRLLQATQPGAMLAIHLPEAELRPYLELGCDLAAVNAFDRCVLAGPVQEIEAVERAAGVRGVASRRLRVSHAFHSKLTDSMLGEFESLLRGIELRAPTIPFVSNVSGRWITSEQACSSRYWVSHVRATVRFSEGLAQVLSKPDRMLLEVGPGEALCSLARRHAAAGARRPILASQPQPDRPAQDGDQLLRCVAQLWVAGVETDAGARLRAGRTRIALPTYPFERESYWIDVQRGHTGRPLTSSLARRELADWFYAPTWKRTEPIAPAAESRGEPRTCALIFTDEHNLSGRLVAHLRARGVRVVVAQPAQQFARAGESRYTLRPGERSDHERLLRAVESDVGPISHICHLLCLDGGAAPSSPADASERGFFCLLALAQALDASSGLESERKLSISVVANGLEDVTGLESLQPDKATLHGPCKVVPQEYPQVRCRILDVVAPPPESAAEARLVAQIAAEMYTDCADSVVAYRGPHRWIKTYEETRRDLPFQSRLRRSGVYLITGGLGGIGLSLAKHLAQAWQARLVLLGRGFVPPRADWEALVAAPDQPHALRQKLQRLLELEQLGAQVLAVQADVCDCAQMQAAVGRARERFGAIHGVIHAAGVSGGGVIANKTREMVGAVFAPKVQGTQVLMSALANESPDFVLFCSSLASIAGGLGNVDYAAANAYLDAAAGAYRHLSQAAIFSVNWDGWRDLGMAAGMRLPEHVGIGAEQGAAAFERIVDGPPVQQIVVSSTDLPSRLGSLNEELWASIEPSTLLHAERRSHARPDLQTTYEEPAGELACRLAQIWSELLGIAPIGASDNLFELGGDSLLAIQVLARIRDTYGVGLHPAAFFKEPTISALAVLVEARLIEEIEKSDAPAPLPGGVSEDSSGG